MPHHVTLLAPGAGRQTPGGLSESLPPDLPDQVRKRVGMLALLIAIAFAFDPILYVLASVVTRVAGVPMTHPGNRSAQRSLRLRPIPILALVLSTALGIAVSAQGFRGQRAMRFEPNVPYDGQFTFARIRYTVYGRSGWEFDYPAMERNLMTVLGEMSSIRLHATGSNIHTFDDPELLKYPIAYLSEPGYWIPSESEALGLRAYLAKGGFLIVDDFMLNEWGNFETQIRRALPGARIERLTVAHPIFDAFFRVVSLDMDYPGRPGLKAEFFGIHEDNDPAKRLTVVINYNTDIGDYMEWSGEGWWPVNFTNDAYKLAVNYIIYGLTH